MVEEKKELEAILEVRESERAEEEEGIFLKVLFYVIEFHF